MTKKETNDYDLIIIGAGGAGLAAAMYGARLNLKTLCLGSSHGTEMPLGGVITTTNVVENYPGFIRLTGTELADKIKEHAESYELVTLKEEKALEVKQSGKEFSVKTDSSSYKGKTILFATGTKWRKLEVPGAKEFENKGVAYCALCLHPDEEIVANSNIIKIKDITPSTRVLTSDGTYQNVAGFTKINYQGKMVKIRPRFFNEPVSITAEHPVLTMQVTKGNGGNYWRDFSFSEPEWKEADELTTADCVLYPIIKETKDLENIQLSEHLELRKEGDNVIPHKQTFTSKSVNGSIPLTRDLMRLFGYYLAEGSASGHELRFYFNKNEKEYLNDIQTIIKNSFGLDSKISFKDNVGYVTLYSKVICDFFKVLFDKYSHAKNLPHFMMLLPAEKQVELLKGLWRGDGCTRDKDFCLVTSSRKMAYQVRDLLLRSGIICSLQKRDKDILNRHPHKIEGRDVSFTKDKYNLNVGGQFLEKMSELLGIRHPKLNVREFSTNHAWIKEGYAVLPIRSIEKVDYNGDVLSIGVEKNSNFVAKNFIVHNCDAPLFKNKVVAVVGGSDSAAKDAMVLAEHAKKVYIIYRGEKIRPEPINYERIMANKKIEVINNTNVLEVKGKQFVEKVILDKPYKGSKELELQGVFVAIGHIIISDLAKALGVKTNDKGEIILDHKTSETNIPGVFAAGDVTDKPFKQLITGVADGCTAAFSAYEYISRNQHKSS